MAYELGLVDVRARIKVFYKGKVLETSIGRIKLNEIIPEKLRFINEEMTKKELKVLVAKVLGSLRAGGNSAVCRSHKRSGL